MRKSQELTKSQKQLLYLLPVLNDRQVAGMLSTLKKPARRAEKNDAYRQLMNMTGLRRGEGAAHGHARGAPHEPYRREPQPHGEAAVLPRGVHRESRLRQDDLRAPVRQGRSRRRASRSMTALPS